MVLFLINLEHQIEILMVCSRVHHQVEVNLVDVLVVDHPDVVEVASYVILLLVEVA